MFAWNRQRPGPAVQRPARAAAAGLAPTTTTAPACPSTSFATLVVSGLVATGIVVWIRGRLDEKQAAKEHARSQDDIERLAELLEAHEAEDERRFAREERELELAKNRRLLQAAIAGESL
jgi:hypothetical protein